MSSGGGNKKYKNYAANPNHWRPGTFVCNGNPLQCFFGRCDQYFECCPECHHLGHPDFYKDPGNSPPFSVCRVTKHAHMVFDSDKGRNLMCFWKDDNGTNIRRPVKTSDLFIQYRIRPARLTDWLKDEFEN